VHKITVTLPSLLVGTLVLSSPDLSLYMLYHSKFFIFEALVLLKMYNNVSPLLHGYVLFIQMSLIVSGVVLAAPHKSWFSSRCTVKIMYNPERHVDYEVERR
jgi:hypothetical protein